MDNRRAGGICGSFTVCIDSYHNGVPVGRFYSDGSEHAHPFEGVTQCLRAMEEQMDGKALQGTPRFDLTAADSCPTCSPQPQGGAGTFALRILFRQNCSWQGSVAWVEGRQEQPFRSVLELILLMDSALQEYKCF